MTPAKPWGMDKDDEKKAQGRRLARARELAGFASPTAAAQVLRVNRETYTQHENGTRGYKAHAAAYARKFRTTPEWLLWGRAEPPSPMLVPVLGMVDANASGLIIRATGQDAGDMAPMPPGGDEHSRAVEVRGHSMGEFAPDGSLIYFSEQHTTPTRDMLGQFVVCQLVSGEILVKRLLNGSRAGAYDLESKVGDRMVDREIVWAALVTASVPPIIARRIVVRAGEAA